MSSRCVPGPSRLPSIAATSSPTRSLPSAGEPAITSATLNVPGANRTPRCPVTAVQLCGFGGRTHSRSDALDDQNPKCEASSSPVMKLTTRMKTE